MKGQLRPNKNSPHALEELLGRGWIIGDKKSHIRLVSADQDNSREEADLVNKYNVRSLPTSILIRNGVEVKRLTGKVSAYTLGTLYNEVPGETLLTPEELKSWCSRYTGTSYTVAGVSYEDHMTDDSAQDHIGPAFKKWQLKGLTLDELQKVHGAQHLGLLTPSGPPQ